MSNKITVKDADREFHVFKGPELRFENDGDIFHVYCWRLDEDGDSRRIKIASFTRPLFVKQADDEAAAPRTTFEQPREHDEFTRRALEAANKPEPPSIKPETASRIMDLVKQQSEEIAATVLDQPSLKAPVMEGPIKFPEGTTFENGAVYIPAAPPKPKRIRPSRAKKNPEYIATVDPQEVYRSEAQEPEDKEQIVVATATGAEIIDKPEEQEPPAETGPHLLEQLKASGAVQTGAGDTLPVGGIAAEIWVDDKTFIDSKGQEWLVKEPDPKQVIDDAEKRHQARLACGTCNGRGVVQDPESDDPLDTTICPDC